MEGGQRHGLISLDLSRGLTRTMEQDDIVELSLVGS